MARGKLRVHVPGFTRKGGVRVHGYNKTVPDKGAPGRGPKLFPLLKEGALRGWSKDKPAGERRRILGRIKRSEGYATVIRRLNALRNISTDRETDAVAKRDMEYLRRNRDRLR